MNNASGWHGKGFTLDRPKEFTAEKDFYFGGRLIPKGSKVKQFETKNFGFTSWTEPDGQTHLAKE